MIGTIYKIANKKNGKIYIGQTIQDFSKRVRSHKFHLKCGVHHNSLLQRVYDKYGLEIFEFQILEKCDASILDEREKYWINYYNTTDRKFGYNFESGGNVNKKHHQETIEKFIENSRGKNNKLTPNEVKIIKQLIIDKESLTEISKKFGVSVDCISKIKSLKNWGYVSPELNDRMTQADTSRKIKMMTDEEIEECKNLILKGESVFNLSARYEIPYRRFSNMFKEEMDLVNSKRSKAESKVLDMFFKNFTIEEILEETKVTYAQYKRITKGQVEKRRLNNILYVGEEVKKGKTNTELAKELNVNRCTISVYRKELLKNKLIP